MVSILLKHIITVGNTPLIYLSSASKEAGTNIYGKAEYLNPHENECACHLVVTRFHVEVSKPTRFSVSLLKTVQTFSATPKCHHD